MSQAGDGGATIDVGPVHVAPGSGVVVRRDGGLLFVEQVEQAAGLIDSFVLAASPDLLDAVTDEATRVGFEVSPFVALSWVDRLHVVVFGALDVVTDHPSMPMLSGSGSSSWVERRVRIEAGTEAGADSTVSIRVGAPADPMSDLQLGRAVAGGFAATFRSVPGGPAPVETAAPTPPSPRQPSPEPPAAEPPAPSAPSATSPTVAPTSPAIPPAADPTAPKGGDRLAALRAAMRSPAIDAEPPEPAAEAPPADAPALVDDEITLAPHDSPPTEVPAPLEPDDGRAPLVAAIRCGRGHVNPTHVGVCRDVR